MFESLKLYKAEVVDLNEIHGRLVEFGYRRQPKVAEEGDFAQRGGILDVFPVTFDAPVRLEFDGDKVAHIRSFNIATGEAFLDHQMAIILPIRGILPKKLKSHRRPVISEDIPINNFVDISPGDYVVHVKHGIGRYRGIERVKEGAELLDYIVLEYAEGAKLYVPISDIDLIQKYIGFEGKPPKVYKLGTKAWAAAKARAQRGIYSLAMDFLEMQAKRQSLHGHAFSKDTDWQVELEKAFPFRDTPAQTRATLEIKRDMESTKPMDRLICGDVGYGKTEVALRAAFKAVMDNKQAALLVPTTILAAQHYATFKSRMKNYPVNIEMLSRFRNDAQLARILDGLKEGAVDIIIGTHRLLSHDVGFKDLGLAIIDEEQRFGVRHKEKLKRMRLLVDVLTLTATPIPRTLYMSLMGIKDMSVVDTPPETRIPVITKVTEYDEDIIKEGIKREIRRGGQVFFVHNRVQGLDKIASRLSTFVPKAVVEEAHGQMPPHQLEDVMIKFIKGEIDVLVSTAIVQSGIDIPNANTIFVNRADMFGLADLYQLRGRVGRYTVQAYSYFMYPKGIVLPKDAEMRLKAIEEHTELGSGFKIAMEDLELRGAGNMLGTEQHGFIDVIGFDLYCRLLRNTIAGLRKNLPA
ncbi:MAG: transcription-repair coupling factor [Candidatus Omnitrophota bacterium]|nr:transcription-repair coupling factor [Candidatus Omnitrophota bacterium]